MLKQKRAGPPRCNDTASQLEESEKLLADEGFVSKLHCKKPKSKSTPVRTQKANGKKSKVRATVGHVFAVKKIRWVKVQKWWTFFSDLGVSYKNFKVFKTSDLNSPLSFD